MLMIFNNFTSVKGVFQGVNSLIDQPLQKSQRVFLEQLNFAEP